MVSKFCYNNHQNAPTIRDKIHTRQKLFRSGQGSFQYGNMFHLARSPPFPHCINPFYVITYSLVTNNLADEMTEQVLGFFLPSQQ